MIYIYIVLFICLYLSIDLNESTTNMSCRRRRGVNDDDGCDDDTLHRDAEKVRKYYDDVMVRMIEEEFETTKHTMSYGEWQRILNYINDRVKYGVRDSECKDFRMRVPFSCLISGKSQCGKTELLLTILSQWRYITTDHSGTYTKKLYWFYGTASIEQTNRVRQIFEEYRNEDGLGGHTDTDLQFVKVHTFKDENVRMMLNEIHTAIVVFDDLMNEMCGDELISNFFSRECHHRKLCIFHVWQNLFPHKRFAVTLSRNTQYKIVFENPEMRQQLNTLFVNMYPHDYKRIYQKIMDFFHSEAPSQFPFVMIRTSPQEKNRDCTIIGYAVNRNVDDLKNHIFTTPPVVIM